MANIPTEMSQEQSQGVTPGEFENTSMADLVTGIHEGMVQLLKNVEPQATPQQKQAISNALQAYRQAINSLGGTQRPTNSESGTVSMEQQNANTIPAM